MTLELTLTKCGLDNDVTSHLCDVVAPYSTHCSGSIFLNRRAGKEIKIRRRKRERRERDYINWQYSLVDFHTIIIYRLHPQLGPV